MEPIKANCVDCPNEFAITVGEQNFFKNKGFELPKRCKPCRDKKRKAREAGGDLR